MKHRSSAQWLEMQQEVHPLYIWDIVEHLRYCCWSGSRPGRTPAVAMQDLVFCGLLCLALYHREVSTSKELWLWPIHLWGLGRELQPASYPCKVIRLLIWPSGYLRHSCLCRHLLCIPASWLWPTSLSYCHSPFFWGLSLPSHLRMDVLEWPLHPNALALNFLCLTILIPRAGPLLAEALNLSRPLSGPDHGWSVLPRAVISSLPSQDP